MTVPFHGAPLFSRLLVSAAASGEKGPAVIVSYRLAFKKRRCGLHRRNTSGRPCVSSVRRETLNFVRGWLWHMSSRCTWVAGPRTRATFWKEKLNRCAEQYRSAIQALEQMGWQSPIVRERQARVSGNSTGGLGQFPGVGEFGASAADGRVA